MCMHCHRISFKHCRGILVELVFGYTLRKLPIHMNSNRIEFNKTFHTSIWNFKWNEKCNSKKKTAMDYSDRFFRMFVWMGPLEDSTYESISFVTRPIESREENCFNTKDIQYTQSFYCFLFLFLFLSHTYWRQNWMHFFFQCTQIASDYKCRCCRQYSQFKCQALCRFKSFNPYRISMCWE